MNRIVEIDALRGIALFGILLVNIFVFHAPICYYAEFYGAFQGIQELAVGVVVDLAVGKFLFIFAFLFGYGMVLQSQSRAGTFHTYFPKRMLVLFGFGILHILLFWFGDILATYALIGLLVLPFVKSSDRLVLGFALFFILFRPLYYTGVFAFSWPTVEMGKPLGMEEFITVFQTGSYSQIFVLRMAEFKAFMPENLVWYIPKTIGLFLAGIFAARRNLFEHIRTYQKRYLAITFILLMLSFSWILFRMDLFASIDLDESPFLRPLLIGVNVISETFQGFGYIFGFILLFQYGGWLTRLLAKVGRMALTSYISQSLFCVLIFYGYGFGFYGKLKPTDLFLISFLIFGFNIVFSHMYLKYRSTGPLEYLWRRLIR